MKVLFAEETNTSVSVTFDNYPVRGKSRQVQSPMCIVKCGEETEIFSYCGTQELVAKLCGKIQKGQLFELSIYEYSSARDVARVFGSLNSKNLFAFIGRLRGKCCSHSNVLDNGPLDRLAFYSFAEARTRYRHDCIREKRKFLQQEQEVCDSQENVFHDYLSRETCISNLVLKKHKLVEGRNTVFFPDLDVLMICDPGESKKFLAACHFIGGNMFPFEGCGRGLPAELRSVCSERFVRVEFEKRIEQEFGKEFAGLSGDELMLAILNSSRKDRALELLHSDIAETSLGEFDFLGSVPVSLDSSMAEEECFCDIFSTEDRRLLFVTYKMSALCVWMVFDKAFWEL